MNEIESLMNEIAGGEHDLSLKQAIEEKFADSVQCFSLPPTFVANKCGVDVQTSVGVVTVVWKTTFGGLNNSVFSMCVVDGCSRAFKQSYKAEFKDRYTELDGLQSVFGAIDKVLVL